MVPFATLSAIRAELDRGPAHVLHITGHGSPGTLNLEDDDGSARLVTAWLARQRGAGGAWQEFHGTGANAWRLALRHVPAWGFGPWELRPVPVTRRPDCPECGVCRASAGAAPRLPT